MTADPRVDSPVDSPVDRDQRMRSVKPQLDKALRPALGAYYLNSRSDAAVALLMTCRYLTQEHVERFLLSDLTARSQKVVGQRLLSRLVKRGLIDRMRYDGRYVYYLKEHRPRGSARINHDLLVTESILRLLEAARLHGHELVRVEVGQDYWTVVPDAYVVYGTERYFHHYFIEIDTGSMNAPAFRQKLDRYATVRRTKPWKDLLPVWPTILVITSSEARAKLLKRTAERMNGKLQSLFTTFEELFSQDPLSSIWQRPGAEEREVLL